MKKIIYAVVLATVAVLGTGCGTLGARAGHELSSSILGQKEKLGVYPGVRLDAKAIVFAPIATIDGHPAAFLMVPFCLADMPISAAIDTCLLPFDIKNMVGAK